MRIEKTALDAQNRCVYSLYKEKGCIGHAVTCADCFEALEIAPEWQSRGYGSYLLREILRQNGGFDRTAPSEFTAPLPDAGNTAAQALAAKFGFVPRGGLLVRLAGAEDAATLLPSGGAELFVQFLALCAVPAVVEELLFRGALQGLMRPSGSAAAIFGPALLFGLLHLDLAQGLTAFACGVFLGWLAERSGSILPGMLLHFCNNTLAFLNLYLRFYAPQPVSFGVELFILFFFPVFGVWLIWHARQQGFRFSAGLRPGVDVTEIFTSPVYDLAVVFLVCYTIFV